MEKVFSKIVIIIITTLTLLLAVSGCKTSKQAAKPVHKDTPTKLPATIKNLEGDEKRLVNEALTWLGTPYKYGGQDYSGTDCSGLTMKVYQKALGVAIPRNSGEQQKFCKSIHRNSLNAGDLVFFCTGKDKKRVSHVGLYIGGGQFVHASTRKGVIISDLSERYYTSTYHSSGQVKRKGLKSRKDMPEQPMPEIKKKKTHRAPQTKKPETEPLRFDLDEAIEEKIDSIYSSFLD
ncbi:MAG TPA: C40 family peptidase [Muribaculum sp.]|jgi:lipoprotein Spr|uniref:C40 family peptidase n=1 Tax=Heminiphilus faecis TaxID=2601703 RepID=A0ABV4CTD9_9BACT|nr:C40 family peptidase [Heminiphilus faecis]RLT75448.1 NlpC/P60 family protein [bacterium J10(2018)]HRF67666.1 C40 family peptidase [Muribaculum sp.]